MTVLLLHAESFKGLKRIRDSQLIDGVGVPGLALVGVFVLGEAWGVLGAVTGYVLATMLVALFAVWLWHRTVLPLRHMIGYFDYRLLLRSSMPMFGVILLDFMRTRATIFFLGIWGTSGDVGVFGVAFRIAALVNFILLAVNSIAAPKFAALYQRQDVMALRLTVQRAALLIFLLATPILLIFILASRWVIGIFGPEFMSGSSILAVLCLGQLANVGTGSVGVLLMMSGNEALMRNIMVVAALTNLVLSMLFIPQWGALGAAIASAVSLVIQNLLSLYFVHVRLQIWSLPFVKVS